MPAISLTPAERKDKRGEAHHLNPVVLIGSDGLTPAVVKETDAALRAHGLIKVRMFSDSRPDREAALAQLAEQLAESNEVAEIVSALEQQYDAFVSASGRGLLAQSAPLPTADELGAQFEAFLADRERPGS